MNQFEFLPLITIGQYFPTGSILHRRDARARLLFFSLMILALTFSPSVWGLVAGLVLAVVGIAISKVSIGYALKGLLTPLPFLIFIVLLQILFFSSTVNTVVYFHWWIVHITESGLWMAFMLLMRFVALILWLSLMSFCLSTSETITGMSDLLSPLSKIGIHTMDFVMIFQVAIRFLPLLAQSAERIAKAQASRGAEWGRSRGNLVNQVKRIVPLIVPLFLISLRRADTMALAMEARAYGLKNQRSSLYELRFTWWDGLFLSLGIGLAALVILL
ncbi:MAG: energy-coupling factor transporter transmembrane protein EcfT [Anaerolineaceae bacterium]